MSAVINFRYGNFKSNYLNIFLWLLILGFVAVGAENMDLYRAVSPSELKQIQETRIFKTLPGMSEGKYFSTNLAGIQQYAEMAENAFGDAPYAYVKTSIPKSVVTDVMKVEVDSGIGSLVIPPENLNLLSNPKILNRETLERSISNVNP